jgi:ribose-phosphate pyrophosphokinase
MIVISLPGGARLAADLARELDCETSELALHRFPDRETLVRIDVPVKGRCVVIAGSLNDPDTKTLPLLFAADAARDLGAAQMGLVAPYLAYMRQDRRFNTGEAITSRSYARLLSGSLDFLVTTDPHLHRWHGLDELYPIRTQVVPAAPAIAQWVRAEVPLPIIVGPDAESSQWVAEVARLCDAPWAVLSKVRHGDRNVSVNLPAGIDWQTRCPVLVDDIVSSGQTLLAAVEALRKAGSPPPVCVAVHALFEGEALWRLLAAGAARVVSCDTIAHSSNAIAMAASLAPVIVSLAGKAGAV